jgi:hypothetical protein
MEIQVPLKRFVKFVQDAEKLDEGYLCLKQKEWLVSNWAIARAVYEPQPMPWPRSGLAISSAVGPFMSWWRKRN